MFKAIKKIFSEEPPLMHYPTTFYMRFDEVDLESAVQQIEDTKKFSRWASLFPILVTSFDRDRTEVGCKGKFYFLLTPLRYTITFVEIIPNESYKADVTGDINGTICGKFIIEEEGIRFYHPFSFRAANWFIHYYYLMFIKPCHLFYMDWRYRVFKNYAICETKEKKLRNCEKK